jgi:hypothetical protein
MDKKIILSLLIVALIGIVAATYQINNGAEVLNPLSNVAVEENPVTQTLAAPQQSQDAAQGTPQEQQQKPTENKPSEATDTNQPKPEESNVKPTEQQKTEQENTPQPTTEQANTNPENTGQQSTEQANNQQANTDQSAQQSSSSSSGQPQSASSDSNHVEGSNSNNGDNQGQNNPQSTIVVNDNPTNNGGSDNGNGQSNNGNGTSNSGNDGSNTNSGSSDNGTSTNNGTSDNSQSGNNSQQSTGNDGVVPDYSQNEGNTSALDEDGEVLDSGINAAVISSSEILPKLQSFVQTKWTQTEPVHLDNGQEYTSDSGEKYYRYDIVRDSDNSVVGQASFNRRTGKVMMMDNSGPTN